MDPITGLAIGGAGADVLGGIVGYLMSLPDKEKARALIQKATDAAGNVDVPTLQRLAATELSHVQTDPALANAQRDSLSRLGAIIDGGGASPQEKADLARIQDQTAQQERSSRGAIMQGMAQRGAAGSGAALASLLESEQGGANRANQAGLDVAAQSQKRYLDSLLAQGQMAGAQRSQEYGEKAAAANAQDLINRYNAGLGQQDYDNQMRRAQLLGGAYTNAANFYGGTAAQTAQIAGGVGHGVGTGMRAVAAYQATPKHASTATSASPYGPGPQEDDETDKDGLYPTYGT